MFKVILFAVSIHFAYSQIAEWGDCTGGKQCASGLVCNVQSQWYSQCLKPSNTPSATTTVASATTSKAASSTASTSKAASSTASTSKAASSTASTSKAASSTSGSGSSSGCSSFINGKFRTGISFDMSTKVNLADYDYITMWMNTIDDKNSTAWNPWYQGAMLDSCINNNKIPLFYAYVIAFEARSQKGLQDCDVDHYWNLCNFGADYIRNNRAHLVSKYSEHSAEIAKKYGTSKPVVFVMEPDFWQFYGNTNQKGGTLSGTYMRALFDDFVAAIRANLPNAVISWDISAWIGESGFKTWWSYFSTADIQFIHTSGGQAHGETAELKPNELKWKFLSDTTGKKIIADCGYGVAGGLSDNCNVWAQSANQNARINENVVALSIANQNGVVARPTVSC